MKHVIHKSQERGEAAHGWLNSNHSFSFGQYYHPQKMGFGMLRVLNDDMVAPGKGFGTHAHDNMEIISIPLSGTLEHKDTMGNSTLIHTNDVQIMSAGTGISHSEYNHSSSDWVNFLQLWIIPEKHDVTPNYDQQTFNPKDRKNKWQPIVSPDAGSGVSINQQAFLYRIDLEAGKNMDYQLNESEHGVYLFVLSGAIDTHQNRLSTKDAIGLWELEHFELVAQDKSELLLIEVPMS